MLSKHLENYLFECCVGTDRLVSYSIAIVERMKKEETRKKKTIVIGNGKMWFYTVGYLLKTFGGDEIKVCNLVEDQTYNQENIILGTPDKINELLESGNVNCTDINLLVVDQPDELSRFDLSMHAILRNVNCQIFWFSSKRNDFTNEIYLKSPIVIEPLQDEKSTNQNLGYIYSKHFYIDVEKESYKPETLPDLLDYISAQCAIYCNTYERAIEISRALEREHHTAHCLHNEMSDSEIEQKINDFRNAIVQNLIISNYKFPKLNFNPKITVNYDLPWQNDKYVKCCCLRSKYEPRSIHISFVRNEDKLKLKELERYYSLSIDECPMDIIEMI
ncbi:predicted protein [Naegleria gruberi]|uniref:Predicted protein n=1 Tax=Naegleria gruberi TaxID=5762 RepID=D2VTP3_NAEGR|nr:uncharacterized protein NAEGRDRAFT_72373 [Naegleria gruberi]EFC39688.1 predicted protein [Naegleria gruberi]|eukprot:XP_002672432.1 predicted protein [Naegleria gruberi strain NEG-M]